MNTVIYCSESRTVRIMPQNHLFARVIGERFILDVDSAINSKVATRLFTGFHDHKLASLPGEKVAEVLNNCIAEKKLVIAKGANIRNASSKLIANAMLEIPVYWYGDINGVGLSALLNRAKLCTDHITARYNANDNKLYVYKAGLFLHCIIDVTYKDA